MTVNSQLLGFTATNTMEVEANTHAARMTMRPEDIGTLGVYRLSGKSGTMAAALTAASRIWSFRWGNGSNYAAVKRITFSAANAGTAFTAGLVQFNLHKAMSFSASDNAGGTELVPTGNMNKLRTSFGTSLLTSCYIAATGAISGGTMSYDGEPFASLLCGVTATAGVNMIPPTPFFDQRPGEYPFILAPNEGFVLYSGGVAIAATGTWTFGVTVDWSEITDPGIFG